MSGKNEVILTETTWRMGNDNYPVLAWSNRRWIFMAAHSIFYWLGIPIRSPLSDAPVI